MPDERSIDEVVAEVRRRAEYASPGPWRLDYTEMPDGSPIWHIWIKRSIGSYAVTSHPTSWCVEEQRASDAEYIATVDPTTVLRLCDEIERLTTMLEALPGLIEQVQTYSDDGEVIVLSQASYNQLREDAGWPVVWSSKKPGNVQEWRAFMKGGE